jgi:UDP-3-O-[3-hydroxymyristoyl] N-acetylglucosamine deacetylase
MNNRLLRELLSHADASELVSFEDERPAPRGLAQLVPAW